MLVLALCLVVSSGGGGVRALEDVLPLSSRYLVSSTSHGPAQQKPDVATLAAENHSLHDAMEQQRFKLKVSITSFVLRLHKLASGTETVQVTPLRRTLASSP